MSWSGFFQILCNSGHLHTMDGYDFDFADIDAWKCSETCAAPMRFWNMVDQTNPCTYDDCELSKAEKDVCCNHGCGYIQLKEKTPPEYKTCNLGYTHCVKPATYEVPKDVGHLVKKQT